MHADGKYTKPCVSKPDREVRAVVASAVRVLAVLDMLMFRKVEPVHIQSAGLYKTMLFSIHCMKFEPLDGFMKAF